MIWLLRHGEAEEGSLDAERRLTPTGERQARDAGLALQALGAEPERCLTSPKVRAADTARLACEPLGVDYSLEPKLGGGPIDPDSLAAGFREILLVGHDPDLSTAVHDATGAQLRLKKGGIAAIDKGELKVLLRPSEIRAIAKH